MPANTPAGAACLGASLGRRNACRSQPRALPRQVRRRPRRPRWQGRIFRPGGHIISLAQNEPVRRRRSRHENLLERMRCQSVTGCLPRAGGCHGPQPRRRLCPHRARRRSDTHPRRVTKIGQFVELSLCPITV